MKAFTKTVTKPEFLKELRKHQRADAFIRGTYQETSGKNAADDFRGCAVGCSLHSIARLKGIKIKFDDHKEYEKHLGVPEWLARVEDRLFEGVGAELAKTWPVEFAKAIHVGADLEKVKGPFLVVIMERLLAKHDLTEFPDVKKSIERVRDLWKNGGSDEEFGRAAWAAWAAGGAAGGAAWAAAGAAAWAAEGAAEGSATRAAWTAWATRAAEYEYFADELLRLLKSA